MCFQRVVLHRMSVQLSMIYSLYFFSQSHGKYQVLQNINISDGGKSKLGMNIQILTSDIVLLLWNHPQKCIYIGGLLKCLLHILHVYCYCLFKIRDPKVNNQEAIMLFPWVQNSILSINNE